MTKKKVVVIGGGHGQSAILRGIKKIDDIDITAIVTVADDGGSTGRLRRHFHIPAMSSLLFFLHLFLSAAPLPIPVKSIG